MSSISQQSASPQATNTTSSTPAANATQSPSPTISGTTTPQAAAPASATARSYASATKKPFSPPVAPGSTGPSPAVAVGASVQSQDGKMNSTSPVNGKNAIPPAVPAVATPAIVNGTSPQGDHSRKSSVTISAAGTSGFIPNGAPSGGPPSRTNSIQFGSMNAATSPVSSHSVPHGTQGSNAQPVSTPQNPRVTSPATSPSPIPQPTSSGGRPPSGLQGQTNGLSFGSMGGEPTDSTARPVSNQNPLAPGHQSGHLRRESSQSTHSDMSNTGMGHARGGYAPQGGRGRGYPQPYPQQMGYSPGPQFRNAPNQPRGGPNMAPQFPAQGSQLGPYPNSPHRSARSPALANSHPATPQVQQVPMAAPQMPAQHYVAYPHMGQQVMPLSSSISQHSLSKHARQSPLLPLQTFQHPLPTPDLSPDSPFFEQYLMMRNQAQFGIPPQFDPAYAHYPQQYGMYPQMSYMAPTSPRPPFIPQATQPQYHPGQYATHPQPQPMSRQSSAVSDRPNSSLGQPQTPSAAPAVVHPHNPVLSSSPGPSSAFKIPTRGKSAGIVIKDPKSGAVKTFEKTPASPAPASASPAIVSSTPTPPPRPASNNASVGPEIKQKSDEEKKNDMKDAIQKKIEADKAEERRQKEEEERKAAKEREEAEQAQKEAEKAKEAAEKAANEAAEREQREKEEAEKAKKAAEEQAQREHEEKARKEEEEKAKKEQEAKEKEEKAKREAEAREKADAAMKDAERAAEEAEEARLKKRSAEEDEAIKAENAKMFAALKSRRPLSAAASAAPSETPTKPAAESGPTTPAAEDSMAPPAKPAALAKREKPAGLKLETNKPVEPAQPSAALQALRSARPIARLSDITYPSSIISPNPALNATAPEQKFKYQRDFLLQFQTVFTEKPSEDWDNKVKETVGETLDSSRPQSARTPSSRGGASRLGGPSSFQMGTFGIGGKTLPPGTTSSERFAMSNGQLPRPPIAGPLGSFNRGGGFPVGGPASLSRTSSSSTLHGQGAPSSPRGERGSRRGNRSKPGLDQSKSRRDDQLAQSMPLTQNMEIKSLQVSSTGWKPRSVGANPAAAAAAPAEGLMPPDMVQRKVKANLNKMTPEKFDKIADQILEIAAQSKDESDGRTLRQVIQLTFEKATDEAHWASMYAKFCKRMLETMSAEIKDESIRDKNGNVVSGGNLFRKYLLNRCQEEFERGWKMNLPPKPEGETEEAAMLSEEYYVAAAAKRRGLGLVQFIGELYKLGMLTERIMHECVKKLVDFEGTPDEAEVESLTKLLGTIGKSLDSTERGPALMEVYFQRINQMIEIPDLNSRLRFMLMDIIDLRRKGWKSKDSEKGPKTIQEIHEEWYELTLGQALALQQEKELEKQRQNQRGGGGRMPLGRGDARSFSSGGYGMMPPPDYQKNTVGMDDLRKLNNKASRQVSQGPPSFGPTSMFNSRSSSGRKTLGPGGSLRGGDESGTSSRTGTPPAQKEKEDKRTSVNAFSALAALDASGEHNDSASPPSAGPSPVLSKATPAEQRPESPSKEQENDGTA
ncbi:hypothetical protein L228DRAFT_238670 [Xylona heveae TC161]|uniref:MIF4G domain-containing protein n=1 Tax=Xylona heveae (strain CBS 132557 / TC161) TaxID=1328760 RepID=A0A165GYD1_XYLHT|nr:hypothetical protein L228DRAFT_238670 [Xylona heveae TC161]KZF22759.1 hypothetical protein L228DRAFT_238670 [Xylona heveae TC161]